MARRYGDGMNFDSDRRAALFDTIRSKAVLDGNKQVLLSSGGGKLDWLIDLRRVFLNPDAMDAIADMFWDVYQDRAPVQIGGMEVAAVPLVMALVLKARQRGIAAHGFLIRKERKISGTGQNIEGTLNSDPVILVDDLINSGESLERAIAVTKQAGLTVAEVFVVIDYQAAGGMKWRQRHKMPVSSIFTLSEFGLSIPAPRETPRPDYAVLWRYYEPGAFPYHSVPKSTPLLVGDHLYMGMENGAMVCVNRHSGQAMWRFQVPVHHSKGIWSSPAYHKGRLYFGAYNGNAYCLDAKTGELVWNNPACEWIGSSPLIVPQHNLLYIGLEYQRPRMMGSNAALDLDTGARVWEIGQKKYQHGSAVYDKTLDAVIFGNADHNVTAYDAKTGRAVWQCDTGRSLKYPPAIDDVRRRVVASSFDGNIYVIDANNGQPVASFQTDDICYTTPLIHGDKIYCGSGDRHMYIIDANRLELIRKIDCAARVYSSPRVIAGRVVFGTNGGRIMELDPDTLDIVGVSQLPDAIPNAISAMPDGSVMYAATHMNELYAIQRS